MLVTLIAFVSLIGFIAAAGFVRLAFHHANLCRVNLHAGLTWLGKAG